MAKSYYSTIFEQTADQVWDVIRDFGTYTWTGSVSESSLEGEKSGVEVGAIRNARLGDTSIFHRQRLLAHSGIDRFYTYEFCEPFPYPIHNFVATLRVTPVIDGNRAFVQWSATFDCERGLGKSVRVIKTPSLASSVRHEVAVCASGIQQQTVSG